MLKVHAWLVSVLLLVTGLSFGFMPAVSGALYWTTASMIQCSHVGFNFEANATIQLTQNGAIIGIAKIYCFDGGSSFVVIRTFLKPDGWLMSLSIVYLPTPEIVYSKDGSGTRFPGSVSFTTPFSVCKDTTHPCSATVSVQKPAANR